MQVISNSLYTTSSTTGRTAVLPEPEKSPLLWTLQYPSLWCSVTRMPHFSLHNIVSRGANLCSINRQGWASRQSGSLVTVFRHVFSLSLMRHGLINIIIKSAGEFMLYASIPYAHGWSWVLRQVLCYLKICPFQFETNFLTHKQIHGNLVVSGNLHV